MPAGSWSSLIDKMMKSYPTWGEAKANFGIPELAEDSPQAVYGLWGAYQRGTKPYGNWLDNQYNKLRNTWEGAAILDPGFRWMDYLESINPNHQWAYTAPNERGERPSTFGGRGRWVF